MRYLFTVLAALLLMGNSPAEIDALLESGSDAEAFAMAEAGAEAGDAKAVGYLGWFYDNGRVVAEDKARATALFRRAAEGGDAYSQWRLGVMIDEGLAQGTPEEAVALFRQAAAQKLSDGMISLAVMHAAGRGVAQDFAAAMRYYQAAARMGNAHGLQGIGVLYANGEGVERNLDEAISYWLVATAAGNETAEALLAEHMTELADDRAPAVLARADAIARDYGVDARFDLTGVNAVL